ncbi:hypothetical protein B005_2245 [Nocardiopsis alba ATCC BAA-2165]|uniref:Uncharacterized protein n=1 Tax=Nocardiopsis alba (strain ATCC BAA-2165 / BE74) TaxID=1205910 RepID=J7LI78_NOCAA|nr:hypothetical protein B005_2245 [Nocardiopsis alba ATCC BAA-2165]
MTGRIGSRSSPVLEGHPGEAGGRFVADVGTTRKDGRSRYEGEVFKTRSYLRE